MKFKAQLVHMTLQEHFGAKKHTILLSNVVLWCLKPE